MFFLAQNSFAEYEALRTNTAMHWSNPYAVDNLRSIGVFFFPWTDGVVNLAVLGLLLGALFMWMFLRVNDAKVYRNLSLSLFAFSLVLVLGFRTVYSQPIFMWLLVASLVLVLANTVCLLGVVLGQNLTRFGFPEPSAIDPKDGAVRYWIFAVLSVLFIFPVRMFWGEFNFWIRALFHYSDMLVFWLLATLAALVSVLAYGFMPWKEEEDEQIFFRGQNIKVLQPIFKLTGKAQRTEIICVGIGSFVVYSVYSLLVHGRMTGADWVGIFLMVSILFQIVRAEMKQGNLQEQVVVKRKRGTWE